MAAQDPSSSISLQRVLDSMPGRTVVISREHRILAANRAYRVSFGGGKDVTGRRCYEVSHGYAAPCDEAGVACPIARTRETAQVTRVLHVHHSSQGAQHEEVLAYPIRDDDGEILSFLETISPVNVVAAETSEHTFVGRSPAFIRMLDLAARVAPTDTPVLLLGESGTGKELLAQALHRLSQRAAGPFVPLDCSGVTESLFESELFGYEKGAFTGAHQRKIGLIETCDGGTLFLDEVGDIPLVLQVKLLRLIETHVFRRLGSTQPRRSDFRLVCATHRDLRQMVEAGTFRRDLFHRLSAFPIPLPPLRERSEDLRLLVGSLSRRLGYGELSRFHPDTLAALASYRYPGNVRELQNIVERSCLLAGAGTVLPEHLPEEVLAAAAGGATQSRPCEIVTLEESERRYLRWALATFRGDRRRLALRLGLSERTLYRKIRDLG